MVEYKLNHAILLMCLLYVNRECIEGKRNCDPDREHCGDTHDLKHEKNKYQERSNTKRGNPPIVIPNIPSREIRPSDSHPGPKSTLKGITFRGRKSYAQVSSDKYSRKAPIDFEQLRRDISPKNFHSLDKIANARKRIDNLLEIGAGLGMEVPSTKPNYKRPKWPFMKLESNPVDSTPHSAPKHGLPDEFTDQLLVKGNQQVKSESEHEEIKQTVINLVKEMLDKMSYDHRMFKGYDLIPIGSSFDDTSVGNLNDFDFYIDLPALRDPGILTFSDQEPENIKHELDKIDYVNTELRILTIWNSNFFSDLHYPNTTQSQNDYFSSIWNSIRIKMASILMELSQASPSSRLTWISTPLNQESIYAFSHLLLWKGALIPNLVVKIDLCLKVTVSKSQIDDSIVWKDEIKDETLHLILRRDHRARISSVDTVSSWREIPGSSGIKKVLRASKVLISRYLPKRYNSDTFSMEAVVPSYWMKTIVFYMLMNYPDHDRYWNEDMLSKRLLEVMQLLKKSLETKQLNSFFIPHNMLKRIVYDESDTYGEIHGNVKSLVDKLSQMQYDSRNQIIKLNAVMKECDSKNEIQLEKHLEEEMSRISRENPSLADKFESIFL